MIVTKTECALAMVFVLMMGPLESITKKPPAARTFAEWEMLALAFLGIMLFMVKAIIQVLKEDRPRRPSGSD